MNCKNKKCSWNTGSECGYPYEISIDPFGSCTIADERAQTEKEGL